jgi:hypothetical protein
MALLSALSQATVVVCPKKMCSGEELAGADSSDRGDAVSAKDIYLAEPRRAKNGSA